MLHYFTFINTAKKEWICFVHGAGSSSAIWKKQIGSFQKEFNVLLIDLRGHGKSKHRFSDSPQEYSFSLVGDDIISVLRHLQIEQTHMVGISLGTIIIRDLAIRYPGMIKSIILGGAVMELSSNAKLLLRIALTINKVLPYMVIYRLFAFAIMPKKKDAAFRAFSINEAKKLGQSEFNKWFHLTSKIEAMLIHFNTVVYPCPILYIMGSEDHLFLEQVKRYHLKEPNSSLYIIPTCGHRVNVESPEKFNQAVIDFIYNI